MLYTAVPEQEATHAILLSPRTDQTEHGSILINTPTRVVYSPQSALRIEEEYVPIHQLPLSTIAGNIYQPVLSPGTLGSSHHLPHRFNHPRKSSTSTYYSDTLSDNSDTSYGSSRRKTRQKNMSHRSKDDLIKNTSREIGSERSGVNSSKKPPKRSLYLRNDDSGVSSACASSDLEGRTAVPLLAKQRESQV